MPVDLMETPEEGDPEEGELVTQDEFNLAVERAVNFQDFYELEHRASDAEHGTGLVPVASATYTQAATVYTPRSVRNWDTFARNAAGDLQLTFGPKMQNDDDWFVEIEPGPATEPLWWREYDDGATRDSQNVRIQIYDNVPTLKDYGFTAHIWGPRAQGAVGLGSSVPVASDDVRNRLCVDGPETVELRKKLRALWLANRIAWARKHHVSGPRTGKHKDIMVVIGAALLRVAGPNLGEVVWQAGWFRPGSLQLTKINGVRLTIDFEMEAGYRWMTATPCVRRTVAAPALNHGDFPNGYKYAPPHPWYGRGQVELGGSHAGVESIGIVVRGYQPAWQVGN